MKKSAKVFVSLLSAAFLFTGLTGCSQPKESLKLQDKVKTVLVEKNDNIVDFRLMGVDVDKIGFEFNVEYNGLAELKDKSIAYASAKYVVPSETLKAIQKRSNALDVYETFTAVLDNQTMDSYTLTPVAELNYVNDAFVRNVPSPFKKYNLKKGLVYGLQEPQFNDETNQISFDVKTLMNLQKIGLQPGWGVGIGFQGGGYGIGVGIFANFVEGDFTTVDRYTVSATKEQYEQFKNDPKLVYKFCADKINEKDASQLSVERTSYRDVAYDNANLLDYFSVPDVEKEFNE